MKQQSGRTRILQALGISWGIVILSLIFRFGIVVNSITMLINFVSWTSAIIIAIEYFNSLFRQGTKSAGHNIKMMTLTILSLAIDIGFFFVIRIFGNSISTEAAYTRAFAGAAVSTVLMLGRMGIIDIKGMLLSLQQGISRR